MKIVASEPFTSPREYRINGFDWLKDSFTDMFDFTELKQLNQSSAML